MKSRIFSYLCLGTMLASSGAFAAKIAVIDSGVDYRHKFLAEHYVTNDGEIKANTIDDDNNGYVDDFYGWNFAENNNQVIDYSYLGRFNSDVPKFFEVQAAILEGTATEADKDWMKAKRNDEKFIKELSVFGNFAHGTHVSGISIRDQKDNHVFGIKLIPTEVKLPFSLGKVLSLIRSTTASDRVAGEKGGIKDALKEFGLNFGLKTLAQQQSKLLTTVGQYTASMKADVANGSFGTGYPQAKMIVEQLYNLLYKEAERDPAQLEKFTKTFLNEMVSSMRAFVAAAPDTVFVFAAGNDGSDNDVYPASPTNVKADNVISVAATMKNNSLAVFSNYGKKMVDVAAPGVGILSSYPGDDMGMMSGTSQAAPYVTNVVATMKSANPKLTPAEVKMMLIATVDKKEWLQGKVTSNGIVNPERAAMSAKLSNTMDVYSAIAESRGRVKDMEIESLPKSIRMPGSTQEAMIQPLPSLFN